jgi:hypothetical protein
MPVLENSSFTIRVNTGASSNRVERHQAEDGSQLIRVWVTCVPEGGKANREVLKALAKFLGVAKSRLEIVKGLKSRDKVVVLRK